MKILFLAKKKPFSEEAAELLKLHVPEAKIIFGERGDAFPAEILNEKYDYVFSYICPWVVPKQVLVNTKIAAINFHPGSPAYPGIGCTNFAIYNNERQFGITVHHMNERVDTGNIIAVEEFPIFANDTVHSLTNRCYAFIFMAFTEIFDLILKGKSLPQSACKWQRRPYRREELDELCKLSRSMSKEEIERRIRATSYPGMPGAYWAEEKIS